MSSIDDSKIEQLSYASLHRQFLQNFTSKSLLYLQEQLDAFQKFHKIFLTILDMKLRT